MAQHHARIPPENARYSRRDNPYIQDRQSARSDSPSRRSNHYRECSSRGRSRSPRARGRARVRERSWGREMGRYTPPMNLRNRSPDRLSVYRDPRRGDCYRPGARSPSRPDATSRDRESEYKSHCGFEASHQECPRRYSRFARTAGGGGNHTSSRPRNSVYWRYAVDQQRQHRSDSRSSELGVQPQHPTSYERYRQPSPRRVSRSPRRVIGNRHYETASYGRREEAAVSSCAHEHQGSGSYRQPSHPVRPQFRSPSPPLEGKSRRYSTSRSRTTTSSSTRSRSSSPGYRSRRPSPSPQRSMSRDRVVSRRASQRGRSRGCENSAKVRPTPQRQRSNQFGRSASPRSVRARSADRRREYVVYRSSNQARLPPSVRASDRSPRRPRRSISYPQRPGENDVCRGYSHRCRSRTPETPCRQPPPYVHSRTRHTPPNLRLENRSPHTQAVVRGTTRFIGRGESWRPAGGVRARPSNLTSSAADDDQYLSRYNLPSRALSPKRHPRVLSTAAYGKKEGIERPQKRRTDDHEDRAGPAVECRSLVKQAPTSEGISEKQVQGTFAAAAPVQGLQMPPTNADTSEDHWTRVTERGTTYHAQQATSGSAAQNKYRQMHLLKADWQWAAATHQETQKVVSGGEEPAPMERDTCDN